MFKRNQLILMIMEKYIFWIHFHRKKGVSLTLQAFVFCYKYLDYILGILLLASNFTMVNLKYEIN